MKKSGGSQTNRRSVLADRRGALLMAGAMALLPVLASRSAMAAGAAASLGRTIHPPTEPMIYRRSLRRTLPGNAHFLVERSFAVRFTPSGTGFTLEGEQISAMVEAPASLDRLASLERGRIEDGLFPILLDPQGLILSGEDIDDAGLIDLAISEISHRLSNQQIDAGELTQLQQFMLAIQQAGSRIVTELPTDLFAPESLEREASREIDLPGGQQGAVSTRFIAAANAETGLMRRATREVVTRLQGERRSILESWSLT